MVVSTANTTVTSAIKGHDGVSVITAFVILLLQLGFSRVQLGYN